MFYLSSHNTVHFFRPIHLFVILALSVGCASDQPNDRAKEPSLREEGLQVFGTPPTSPPSASPTDPSLLSGHRARPSSGQRDAAGQTGSWSIVLGVFRGEAAREEAATALQLIRTSGGLPEAYAEHRGGALVVAYGRYAGPDDARARADLDRLKEVRVRGTVPYAYAFLAPPAAGAGEGARPEYNLARAKEKYGEAALYTLQIGVYGRDDLPRPTAADLEESRRLAEDAAAKLRQEGELAFYFHGPSRSMVTVGVFDTSDIDPQAPGFQSARLRDAKKRHPHNLYNGAGIRAKRGGRTGSLQASTLVAIPEK